MKTKLTALMVGLTLAASVQAAKHDVDIRFSKGISKKFRKVMDKDLEVLQNTDFHYDADENTLKVMELSRLNSDSAVKWLEDRVQYVIEDTDFKKIERKLEIEERYYSFENAGIKPTIETGTAKPTTKGVTVMSNLGAALYYAGKEMRSLLSYPVKLSLFRKESVKFSSPRAGLIMIGEGHFMERFNHDQNDGKAVANSYQRLSTFFHEARHSDGAGENLGFFHAVCPDGHDFQGLNACDRNLNGPYTVGAQMTLEFLKNCESCDDEVKERMKVSYLSSLDRVITETKKPVITDNFEVRMIEISLQTQELLLPFQQGEEAEATKKEIAKLRAQILAIAEREGTINVIKSKFVDASPEGQRIE